MRVSAALALFALCMAPVTTLADDNARGRQLFELCQQCHGVDGGGMQLALAPALAGVQQWYLENQLKLFRDGIRGMHPDDIAGMRMSPMARWLRTDEDITAVSAYAASLPPVDPEPTLEGGNAEAGKATFTTLCITCHGPDAKGMQQMNAPALAGRGDWYLLSSLERYKAGVRGSDPRNINASTMRGMAGTLADEQAMKDVIAYIMSLSD